ncbi:MAG: HAD-IA family hydrolase [Chloroflexi bacterium]|nr:HAD-IA family hydrolase [Chloroflexota bacterium]
MIKAVLLDLDNTLLRNPDRQWARTFIQGWDRYFEDRHGITRASVALRSAIGQLNQDGDTCQSNADVMAEELAKRLPLSREELESALDEFYAGPYHCFRETTAPIAGARELVEALLDQDLLVAVATNPLFPESATYARIAWAGLADYISAFAFITNSENMHYAKPDPAYFAETIARVGVEPDEALVIGDSLPNDIEAAQALGIHAWQVCEDLALGAVLERVRQPDWVNALPPGKMTPETLPPQFKGNLAALRGLLAEVKDHQWLQRPDPAEWSILQILCHLWRAETEVHQQRLRTILQEDNPFIPSLPPPGPDIPECHDDGMEVFARFRSERQRTMATLAELCAGDWRRPARHSIFGLTDLLEMAYFTAQHDRLHITQLCQTLGKCAD